MKRFEEVLAKMKRKKEVLAKMKRKKEVIFLLYIWALGTMKLILRSTYFFPHKGDETLRNFLALPSSAAEIPGTCSQAEVTPRRPK